MSKLTATIKELERRADKYYELLYAVQTKFPGETRHQTALRYIREAEDRPINASQSTNETEK